jgi:hypothetical protein
MNKFTRDVLTHPRARRKADAKIIFEGHGFQITELSGNEGSYWDVRWPSELDVREAGYTNLCIAGRVDGLNEVDGQWFYNDAQHPMSARFADDGSLTEEPHLIRSPGITRLFFGDGTKRLCIYPVDAFGQHSGEKVGGGYMDGPCGFTLRRGTLFVLSRGPIFAAGSEVQAPNVIFAKTMDVPIVMSDDSHGAIVWKA